ncbi:hypothetical protein M434DRAFT_378816 [Hypoxylon sp. CO27-5]|nr:hypothetical protein M434DRAFT_378816 [Hypoxylon sp. CO27-5]
MSYAESSIGRSSHTSSSHSHKKNKNHRSPGRMYMERRRGDPAPFIFFKPRKSDRHASSSNSHSHRHTSSSGSHSQYSRSPTPIQYELENFHGNDCGNDYGVPPVPPFVYQQAFQGPPGGQGGIAPGNDYGVPPVPPFVYQPAFQGPLEDQGGIAPENVQYPTGYTANNAAWQAGLYPPSPPPVQPAPYPPSVLTSSSYGYEGTGRIRWWWDEPNRHGKQYLQLRPKPKKHGHNHHSGTYTPEI